MKRLTLICISLFSLLAITSCSSPKQEAEQVTKKFYKALYQGRFDEASSYTGSKQALYYVDIFKLSFSKADFDEVSSVNLDRAIRVVATDPTDDGIIECHVKFSEDKNGKEFGESQQKVFLKKIDGKWKIVSIPMNK